MLMTVIERLTLETEPRDELRQLHLSRYQFAGDFVKNKVVLDAACGTGYGTAMLAGRGAESVTGVDISRETIAYAKRRYERPRVRFIEGDVQNLTATEQSDIVVSFETIGQVRDPSAFLRCVTEILKSDGTLIISTPIRSSRSGRGKVRNPFFYNEWNRDEVIQMLRGYFARVEIHYQYDFKKQWYPYSRTLSRMAARLLYPSRFKEFTLYRVNGEQNKLPGIPVTLACIVAVCSRPIK